MKEAEKDTLATQFPNDSILKMSIRKIHSFILHYKTDKQKQKYIKEKLALMSLLKFKRETEFFQLWQK